MLFNLFADKGRFNLVIFSQNYQILVLWITGSHLPQKFARLHSPAPFFYLPEGRHPIIPFFQHSIIPINCERSELSSLLK